MFSFLLFLLFVKSNNLIKIVNRFLLWSGLISAEGIEFYIALPLMIVLVFGIPIWILYLLHNAVVYLLSSFGVIAVYSSITPATIEL